MDFGNGVSFSTIWGIGSYTENRDIDKAWGDIGIVEAYDKHDFDTGTVELYFLTGDKKLYRKLAKKYSEWDIDGGHHFDTLPVEKWFEIINICIKYKALPVSTSK